MKRPWSTLLILMLLTLSLACRSLVVAPSPTAAPSPTTAPTLPPATPLPAEPKQPPATPGPILITFQNHSGETICYVRISPTASDSWGEDWLGADETLAAGADRTFAISPGSYDLRAENCNSDPIYEEWNLSIFDNMTLTAGGGREGMITLLLDNASGETICYVYISPTADTSWGPDRLENDEVIPAWENRAFTLAPGSYDLRADDCNQEMLGMQWGFELIEDAVWTAGIDRTRIGVSFVADRYYLREGECATISWNVRNATRVIYEGRDVAAQGSEIQCPLESVLLQLEVEGLSGSWQTETLKLTVLGRY